MGGSYLYLYDDHHDAYSLLSRRKLTFRIWLVFWIRPIHRLNGIVWSRKSIAVGKLIGLADVMRLTYLEDWTRSIYSQKSRIHHFSTSHSIVVSTIFFVYSCSCSTACSVSHNNNNVYVCMPVSCCDNGLVLNVCALCCLCIVILIFIFYFRVFTIHTRYKSQPYNHRHPPSSPWPRLEPWSIINLNHSLTLFPVKKPKPKVHNDPAPQSPEYNPCHLAYYTERSQRLPNTHTHTVIHSSSHRTHTRTHQNIFILTIIFKYFTGQKATPAPEREAFKCPVGYGNGNFADPATCRKFYQVRFAQLWPFFLLSSYHLFRSVCLPPHRPLLSLDAPLYC